MSDQTGEGTAVKVKRTVNSVIFGNWNAEYTRENQRRMLYLQQKYIEAYASSRPPGVETVLEETSRLRLTTEGKRPANPFHDVHAWDNALHMPSDLVAGHQGRWTASHARLCLGRINEYQLQRRDRMYLPGIQKHGRANDVVNMFLQELKEWIMSYFTLENVKADELSRRSQYLSKVKMDNFHWCFPNESSSYGEHNFHDVIDFVHDKIKDALDITEREERNRSMSDLLKELNDHVTNVCEYGKGFLANILYSGPKNKAGADLLSSVKMLDRKSYVTGMLLSLLENTLKSNSLALTYNSNKSLLGSTPTKLMVEGSSQRLALENGNGNTQQWQPPGHLVNHESGSPMYQVKVTSSAWSLSFHIDISGPVNGIRSQWSVKRTKYDFNVLQRMLDETIPKVILIRLPWAVEDMDDELNETTGTSSKKGLFGTSFSTSKLSFKQSETKEDEGKSEQLTSKQSKDIETERLCSRLELFLDTISRHLSLFPPHALEAISKFYDIQEIDPIPRDSIIPAEDAPQVFTTLKEMLLSSPLPPLMKRRKDQGASKKPLSKKEFAKSAAERNIPYHLAELEMTWGREHASLILEAHALLQRTSILLGWTREVNAIFASMFGNSLAFSKLPLKELLETMRQLLTSSLSSYKEIHKHACDLNALGNYKWHRNLRASEQVLLLVLHHTEGGIGCIETLQREHLDEEMQRKRLLEVAEKFVGFMDRIDRHLPMLKSGTTMVSDPRNHIGFEESDQERDRSEKRLQNILDNQYDLDSDCLDKDTEVPIEAMERSSEQETKEATDEMSDRPTSHQAMGDTAAFLLCGSSGDGGSSQASSGITSTITPHGQNAKSESKVCLIS